MGLVRISSSKCVHIQDKELDCDFRYSQCTCREMDLTLKNKGNKGKQGKHYYLTTMYMYTGKPEH